MYQPFTCLVHLVVKGGECLSLPSYIVFHACYYVRLQLNDKKMAIDLCKRKECTEESYCYNDLMSAVCCQAVHHILVLIESNLSRIQTE